MDKNSLRARALVSVAIALVVSLPVFARQGRAASDKGPQRAVAFALNGEVGAFTLADGSALEVPAGLIRIAGRKDVDAAMDRADRSDRAERTEGSKKSHRGMSVQELVTLSQSKPNALPAVVHLKYSHDGMIKRVRVMMFEDATQASSFVDRAARNRAEIKAAKPKN